MEDKAVSIFEQNNKPSYTSIKADSEEDKIKLLNALENCDFLLNDVAPTELAVKDVFIQPYEKEAEDGETKQKYRTILFDTEGKSYVTTSTYFFFALSKIFNVLGTPDKWSKPYTFEIYKKALKSGNKALSVKVKA